MNLTTLKPVPGAHINTDIDIDKDSMFDFDICMNNALKENMLLALWVLWNQYVYDDNIFIWKLFINCYIYGYNITFNVSQI